MKRKPDSSISLRTLLDSFYVADRAISPEQVGRHRTAIKRFSEFLGRVATLADVTPKQLLAFYADRIQRGLRTGQIEGYRDCLGALVRYAADRGLIEGDPIVPVVQPGMEAKPPAWSWNQPGTLAYYFAHVFKAEQLADYRPTTIMKFDAAVRLFMRFSESQPIDNFTPEIFKQFEVWLRDAAQVSEGNVVRYVNVVERVFRHWKPEAFAAAPAASKGTLANPSAVAPIGSLRWFFETRFLSEHGIGQGTEYHYRLVIRRYSEHLGREAMLTDFSSETLNGYLVARLAVVKARTVKSERGALIVLWRSAFDWNLVDELPRRIRKVKPAIIIPDSFTPAEVTRLIAASRSTRFDRVSRHGVHVGRFLEALVRTAYDTALRLGDLLSLRRDMIGDDGMIVLTMEKTGLPHVCEISRATAEALARAGIENDDRLLPWPPRRVGLHGVWKLLLREAGIPVGRRNGVQKLRRTSASFVEAGSPGAATGHLGHRSADLARRHYLDPRVTGKATLPPPITEPPALLEGPRDERTDDAA